MRRTKQGLVIAEPADVTYTPPEAGGCWLCNTGRGTTDPNMEFDDEFDTWFHPECLDTVGVDSVLEYEKEGFDKGDRIGIL